ncbi:MAG TPA: YeeE/YedE thiosulfate transporter family protein [Fibrobacteria bacterium]|nr:YeeE/YedE thiosulfate transporter family protein [Fibrobacteria bacterium]
MPSSLLAPWPWWVAGPLIGLTVPLMILVGGKNLGISSSFRHLCAAILPKSTLAYLRSYDWRKESWSLLFVAGLVLGGFVATCFLSSHPQPLLPPEIHDAAGALKLLGGGLLIGFGTRYAAGCTSGHSIMGLSNLQKASLVATFSFFAGGLTGALILHLMTGVAWGPGAGGGS